MPRIVSAPTPGMGSAIADFDGDGRLDFLLLGVLATAIVTIVRNALSGGAGG